MQSPELANMVIFAIVMILVNLWSKWKVHD